VCDNLHTLACCSGAGLFDGGAAVVHPSWLQKNKNDLNVAVVPCVFHTAAKKVTNGPPSSTIQQ
jgi:hypothetical protein